ncbi:oxygenase MpaB family protein [Nocardia sp. NPDC051570]|uniref:oxygenase MpaB family protein n=1 Tax=Nocardia sp. NPDC051570 TaxID=3364324 RepID=UPI0037A44122
MTAPLRYTDPESPPTPEFTPQTVRRHMDGVAAFLGGAANVVMQLSHPPVGYGVLESPVDSGKATLHPIKRLRTTLTYLAVAWLGTEGDRRVYRDAVNASHRPIRSKPGAAVRYNAFDPKLQLWVAACLYWGVDDLYTRMHGPMESDVAEAFYRYSARLGTTLQMRPEMWPADRAAFYRYWDENLAQRTIDEPVRRYFDDLIDLKNLSPVPRIVFGRIHRFGVTALLPQRLRDQMGMTWTARDERRYTGTLRLIALVWVRLPEPIRVFPFNYLLLDMRLRNRLGRPLV